MGSRGAFKNANFGDFHFSSKGQEYICIKKIGNIEILIKNDKTSVNFPLFSHSENAIYVTLQKGKIKYITFYKDHNVYKEIDFFHKHNQLKPHYHLNMNHNFAFELSLSDIDLINSIKKELKIK